MMGVFQSCYASGFSQQRPLPKGPTLPLLSQSYFVCFASLNTLHSLYFVSCKLTEQNIIKVLSDRLDPPHQPFQLLPIIQPFLPCIGKHTDLSLSLFHTIVMVSKSSNIEILFLSQKTRFSFNCITQILNSAAAVLQDTIFSEESNILLRCCCCCCSRVLFKEPSIISNRVDG